ncbi:unnamed protein product [Lactuca virosa]|uniref:Uncharacterized protein n=1 Tax=Lactuca virosa TaxID=75947 RepID=A0AAU9P4G9_9ASTR|nr:unnamed protein product [Lactuca virosa]
MELEPGINILVDYKLEFSFTSTLRLQARQVGLHSSTWVFKREFDLMVSIELGVIAAQTHFSLLYLVVFFQDFLMEDEPKNFIKRKVEFGIKYIKGNNIDMIGLFCLLYRGNNNEEFRGNLVFSNNIKSEQVVLGGNDKDNQ